MENFKDAFQTLASAEKLPNVYQFVNYQRVFHIKKEDF